ncbi:MAG: energy-coupling factor transporter transmembrane protein EcfT [Oscillospiraceae bacterium]|nr:energy-coupling factor transporter transmembrane protein EcfT [Oscillospiraceae bacterium]
MLKDITLGQYFPGKSFIHKMDSRMKIIITMLYIIMLFTANNIVSLFGATALLFLFYIVAKIPVKMITKSLKPVMPIIVFTALLNMLFMGGEPIFEIDFIKITELGILMAVLMCVRIVALIAGTSLLTYTTSPIALTDAIEALLKPLNKINVPVHELAMMMTIALRFIPTLIEETEKIMNAQKARGADMETGGLMQRARALVPILIPLFVSAFRRADELALAMECRCYRGGEGRTRMKQLKMSSRDGVALVFMIVLFAAVLAGNVQAVRMGMPTL